MTLKGELHFVGFLHQLKEDHLLIPVLKHFVNQATSFEDMSKRVQSFVAVPACQVVQWTGKPVLPPPAAAGNRQLFVRL